jgi:hypothetical protein
LLRSADCERISLDGARSGPAHSIKAALRAKAGKLLGLFLRVGDRLGFGRVF